MKKVAVVILNYQGTKDTLECIQSLKNTLLSDITVQIILVDNASSTKVKEYLQLHIIQKFKDTIFIQNDKNMGFAEGNNIGIHKALELNSDYITILNNDTTVDKYFFIHILSTFKQKESIGITVPKIYFTSGYEYHKDRYAKSERGHILWYAGGVIDWNNIAGIHRGVDEVDNGQYDSVEKTEFATGCCMMVRSEIFKHVGFFDSRYFLYYEDTDLSVKLRKKGYSIVYNPTAIIWHKNAGSAGGSGSSLQDYYITRNRLLFGLKYAPLKSKSALVKESLKLLVTGRPWQKKGVIDYYLRRLGRGTFPLN